MSWILPINLHTIIGLIIISFIVLAGFYYYSVMRKRWFHLFVRLVWSGKIMMLLFAISIYIIIAYKVDCLKIPVSFPGGLDQSATELMFTVASGYISGYIVYLLSVLVPKAIRQRSILLICKNNIWYAKGEIEYNICGENTKNKYDVLSFLKKGSSWNNDKACFIIPADNVIYISMFLNRVSNGLNSIMAHTEYIDTKDLHNISKIANNITKVSERLKDIEGNIAYYDANSLEELAISISTTYESFTKLYFKLEQLV